MSDLSEKVGKLDGRMDGLEKKLDEVHYDVKTLVADMNKRKGSSTTWGMVGGAVVTVVTVVIRWATSN